MVPLSPLHNYAGPWHEPHGPPLAPQTLGNHEFDNGVGEGAGLAGFIANISGAFPVLSCNLDISGEPGLEGLVQPYALIDLPLANVTVGVVGLTSIDTPDTSNPGAPRRAGLGSAGLGWAALGWAGLGAPTCPPPALLLPPLLFGTASLRPVISALHRSCIAAASPTL